MGEVEVRIWKDGVKAWTRRAPQVVAIIVRATDIHLGYTAPATNLMHLLKERNPWVPLFEKQRKPIVCPCFFLQFMKLLDSR